MNLTQLTSKSDLIGTTASTLCLIHCVATPLLFVAQAGIVGHEAAHPMWWGALDIFFLVISYFAVWWSSEKTSKKWMRNALWVTWSVLAFFVVNEKLAIVALPEIAVYVPAIGLIGLHLYNRRYCHCADEKCCAS